MPCHQIPWWYLKTSRRPTLASMFNITILQSKKVCHLRILMLAIGTPCRLRSSLVPRAIFTIHIRLRNHIQGRSCQTHVKAPYAIAIGKYQPTPNDYTHTNIVPISYVQILPHGLLATQQHHNTFKNKQQHHIFPQKHLECLTHVQRSTSKNLRPRTCVPDPCAKTHVQAPTSEDLGAGPTFKHPRPNDRSMSRQDQV